MPVRREDKAHALELLEQYSSALKNAEAAGGAMLSIQERELRNSLDKVIMIFKSDLFDALLDIQEFYEMTLANETRGSGQKGIDAFATWDLARPIGSLPTNGSFPTDAANAVGPGGLPESEWVIETIELKRGPQGFGLSIAGGTDKPQHPDDTLIYITNVVPGGVAAQDGRLQVNDIVVSVNDVSTLNVTNAEAIGALKKSTTVMKLVVKRPKFAQSEMGGRVEEIVLTKGTKGLGFSVAGGVGNEHVAGDPGIYITKIIEGGAAHLDGRLAVGDKLLQVNDIHFDMITHEEAVSVLKNTQQVVRLLVMKPAPPQMLLMPGAPSMPMLAPWGSQMPMGGEQPGYMVYAPGFPAAYPPGAVQMGGPFPPVNMVSMPGQGFPMAPMSQVAPQPMAPLQPPAPAPVPQQPSPVPVPVVAPTPKPAAPLPPAEPPAPRVPEKLPSAIGQPMPELPPAAPPKPRKEPPPLPPPELTTPMPAPAPIPAPVHVLPPLPPPKPEEPAASALPLLVGQVTAAAPAVASRKAVPPPPPKPKAVPPPPPPQDPRAPRKVVLVRGPQGLGFNIMGGEDPDDGIFISHLVPGGSADQSGLIRQGDMIIEAGGVNLHGATHEDAAAALKAAGNNVELVLRYAPEEYERFERKLEELQAQEVVMQPPHAGPPVLHPRPPGSKPPPPLPGTKPALPPPAASSRSQLIVRALFDYDPTKDSGLPGKGIFFKYGDILLITNSSDDDWWQAKRLRFDGIEEPAPPGIIPSRKRVEKKERARQKRIGWGANQVQNAPDEKARRDKPRRPDEAGDEGIGPVFTYEAVSSVETDYARPVIVLGPFKDKINDELIAQFPDKFGTCVPHTSRALREGEANGREYHFVSREDMDREIAEGKFIEAGHYSGNLYGTSVAAVNYVARDLNRHCLLDVSANAVKRLVQNNLVPISLLVKPNSINVLMDVARMGEEQAKKALDRLQKTESDFMPVFTAIVAGDTFDEIQARVVQVVEAHGQSNYAWLPDADTQLP